MQAKTMRVVVAALKDKSINDDKLISALREAGTCGVPSKLSRKSSLGGGTTVLQPLSEPSVGSVARREGLAESLGRPDQDGDAVLHAQIRVLQERLAGRDRQVAELQDLLLQRNAQLAEGIRASGDGQGDEGLLPPSGVPVLVEDADM